MAVVITERLIQQRASSGLSSRSRVRPQILFFHSTGRRTFSFPFAPREVSYSQLAGEFNEIKRPGGFPILERSGAQLMQVSMQFRVADLASRGSESTENRLNMLREIAVWPGFVLVTNMDSFLSRPTFPTQRWLGAKFAKFLITDLGIEIVQRNLNNYATQADVSLTLTEDRNPFVFTTVLPRIQYEDAPQRVSGAAAIAAGGGPGAPASGGSGSSGGGARPAEDFLSFRP
jgi:hypothetical protein